MTFQYTHMIYRFPSLFSPGIPSFFIEMLPHCRVDVVELEAAVVEASKDVGFQKDPRISITVQDGAMFAQDAITSHVAYDAVIIDAYDADGNVPKTFSSDGPFLEAGSRRFGVPHS